MGLLRQAQLAGPGMPVAAAAGPAPVRENSILLIGGDKRGNSPDPSRPVAQSRDILVYDVIGNTWTRRGMARGHRHGSRRCQGL